MEASCEAGVERCGTANHCWAGPAGSCYRAGGREGNSSSSLDCSASALDYSARVLSWLASRLVKPVICCWTEPPPVGTWSWSTGCSMPLLLLLLLIPLVLALLS